MRADPRWPAALLLLAAFRLSAAEAFGPAELMQAFAAIPEAQTRFIEVRRSDVLRAPLEETLRRANARSKRIPLEFVRHMHAQLAELGEFERHVVDTTGRTPEETLAEIARRRARGELRLRSLADGS